MRTLTLTITVFMLVITSCNSDKTPKESQSKNDLQQIFKDIADPNDLIEVLDFTKTNGLNKKINENDYYIMEFTSIIKYTLEGWVNIQNPNAPPLSRKIIEYSPIEFEVTNVFDGYDLDRIDKKYAYLEKGATLKLVGKLTYEKTEEGWRTVKHEFDSFEIIENKVDLSQWWNKEYYDKYVGAWYADNNNAYTKNVTITKEGETYFATFNNESHKTELWIKNRKLCFYETDLETYLTYWLKKDKLIFGDNGTYHKVAESIPIEKGNIYQETAHFLKGEWKGKLDNKNIIIFISDANNGQVYGYNQVGSNKRNVSGNIYKINESNFNVVLQEPGDHKWDGVFNLTFNNTNGTWKGTGNWKSNDGKLNRSVTLEK